jgi:hypothetical protein
MLSTHASDLCKVSNHAYQLLKSPLRKTRWKRPPDIPFLVRNVLHTVRNCRA